MVSIGRYSMLAPEVKVVGLDHVTDLVEVPMQFSGRPEQRPTTIGRDVWVGHGALIMRGVTIGDGAIVGARAIVTKDVEPFSIVVGVPAREVARRFRSRADESAHRAAIWGALISPEFCAPLPLRAESAGGSPDSRDGAFVRRDHAYEEEDQ
jgi:hypothetical protein